MKINFLLVLIFLIAFSGCSQEHFKARYHLFKAEQAYWQANYRLRSQKVSFEKRQPLFVQACNEYIKAIELDAGVFNSSKIEEASQSCASADNREASYSLDELYMLYCQDHPKECEYGFMPSNPEISEF